MFHLLTSPYALTFSSPLAGYKNVCVADSIYCTSDDEHTIQYYVRYLYASLLPPPPPTQSFSQSGNSLVFQSGRAPKCVDFERCPPKAIAFSEFQNCLELNNRVQGDMPISCTAVNQSKLKQKIHFINNKLIKKRLYMA